MGFLVCFQTLNRYNFAHFLGLHGKVLAAREGARRLSYTLTRVIGIFPQPRPRMAPILHCSLIYDIRISHILRSRCTQCLWQKVFKYLPITVVIIIYHIYQLFIIDTSILRAFPSSSVTWQCCISNTHATTTQLLQSKPVPHKIMAINVK